MHKIFLGLCAALIMGTVCSKPVLARSEVIVVPEPGTKQQPAFRSGKDVELVFVVDTTGSMGGLIQGAKTKIWTIVNEILQYQKKGTRVRIGLIDYRDRGDEYITQLTELSEYLDSIHHTLWSVRAAGG